MGLENLSTDLGEEIVDLLPVELIGKIDKLVLISKIAVIIFICYILFLIMKQFFGWRRNKKIDKMYYKIDEIDKKLNFLLSHHKKLKDKETNLLLHHEKMKQKEKSNERGFFKKLFKKKEVK